MRISRKYSSLYIDFNLKPTYIEMCQLCYFQRVDYKGIVKGLFSTIADFTTPGRSHIYGLPCPSADSLDPMDLYYALMFQDHPKKLSVYTYTRFLKQYSRVYVAFDLKPVYIGMCTK